MELQEAVDWVSLRANTQSPIAPLTAEEVTLVVTGQAIADDEGLTPDDPDWVPTYRLNQAVALCLEWRATKALEMVDTSTDGTTLSHHQIYKALRQEAISWRAKTAVIW